MDMAMSIFGQNQKGDSGFSLVNASETSSADEDEETGFIDRNELFQDQNRKSKNWVTRSFNCCWKRRTILEMIPFLVICVLSALGIAVLPRHADSYLDNQNGIIFTFDDDPAKMNYITQSAEDGSTVCTSSVCVIASARIMSNMDSTVDPCQDFYQYACGGWIRHSITGKSYGQSILQQISNEIQVVTKNILERSRETFPSEAEKLAKDFYQSCIDNNNEMWESDAKFLLDLLRQIKDWPAETMPTNWNFQQVLETTHNMLHSDGFFKWEVTNYNMNSKTNDSITRIIELRPSRFSFIPDWGFKGNKENYTKAIKKVLELLNISTEKVKQVVDDILTVEKHISGIEFLALPFSFVAYNKIFENSYLKLVTIEKFQDAVPFINWKNYFQSAFSQVNISINSSSQILNVPMDFFYRLDTLISTTLSDKKSGPRMLHNYMGWHVTKTYLPYLSREFRDFNCLLFPQECRNNADEYWRFCVEETNNVMSFAVEAMYVQQELDPETKPSAESMVKAIKEAFENNFDHLGWMDSETRQAAREKVKLMTQEIGYPEFILNSTLLDDFFNGLEINSYQFFLNKVRTNKYFASKNWFKLDKPLDETIWSDDIKPMDINAYYSRNLNKIVLPAGLLRNPLFDVSLPHSINFGAAGFYIGHELTHGFDNNGRLYDWNGEERQWWNNATIESYNQQAECLIDQYSSYELKWKHLDGQKTLGENIADNGGLKASFRAFTNWAGTRNENLLTLPGLNLTHNQLFFLSYAQSFCSSYTNDIKMALIMSDYHSLDSYRVIGTLSNMVEFSSAFQCPSGSPMNPQDKCELW